MQLVIWNVALVVLAGAGALVLVLTGLCALSVITKRDYLIEFIDLYR